MAKSTLDMGQSDLEDFTDAQDSQDWLSTLTKSKNKVRELQSLLIAKSKQWKDQVAELQTALDREKCCVKDLKKELCKTEKRCDKLKADLYRSEDRCEYLRAENIMKRLHWYDKKAEEKEVQRQKKARMEKEKEIKNICIEEEKRERISEEIRQQ